jgi:hypothetical protein
MRHIIVLCCIILSTISFAQKKNAGDRAAERNKITILYPEIALDVNECKNAIAYGTSTIKGVLFTKEKNSLGIKPLLGAKTFGSNLTVTLFPVTSYFNAWYDLRKRKENKRTNVYMSEEAFYYKITTTTDEYGRFWFEKMKPGKYFLQAFITVNYQHTAQVNVGSGTNQYGGNITYYENQQYLKEQSERMEKFVEIDADGEIVDVKLK